MKKVISLVMVLCMVFALTGCKGSDYKKAMAFLDEGDYAAAEELFIALGDYEDSAELLLACRYGIACECLDTGDFDKAEELLIALGDYENSAELLKGLPVERLISRLESDGRLEYKNPNPAYTVTLWAESGKLRGEYLFSSKGSGFSLEQKVILTITPGDVIANIESSSYTGVMAAYIEDEGSGTVDISAYKAGDEFELPQYKISGKKIDGAPLDAGATGLALTASGLERLVGGIAKLLEQTGLNVTLEDIGFSSYGK